MTPIKVPSSASSLNRTVAQLVATKDVADWTLAAIIYAWTTGDDFTIDRAAVGGFTAAPGFSSASKVHAYREAYEVAISEGLVKPVFKGDSIVVPTVRFADYVEGSQWKIKARKAAAKSKARSRQQENLERDGHKPVGPRASTPSVRVATPKENIERAIQEVDVALKKVTGTGVQRQQIEFARLQLTSALATFTKATAS